MLEVLREDMKSFWRSTPYGINGHGKTIFSDSVQILGRMSAADELVKTASGEEKRCNSVIETFDKVDVDDYIFFESSTLDKSKGKPVIKVVSATEIGGDVTMYQVFL